LRREAIFDEMSVSDHADHRSPHRLALTFIVGIGVDSRGPIISAHHLRSRASEATSFAATVARKNVRELDPKHVVSQTRAVNLSANRVSIPPGSPVGHTNAFECSNQIRAAPGREFCTTKAAPA
jgi:hypothetical protein